MDRGRRDFLIRGGQGASAAVIAARFGRFPFPFYSSVSETSAPPPDFHLHPHYRAPLPLDAVLRKANAGFDDFITEKYADQIAAILAQWTSGCLRSPQDVDAVQKVLAPGFSAASFTPANLLKVRPGPPIEIHRRRFSQQLSLAGTAFLEELRTSLSSFAKILTAEFQVTGIDARGMQGANGVLRTRVRYELVGAGRDFYREQRVGYWNLLWEASAPGDFRLRTWQAEEETQSRANAPGYVDIAAAAMGGNASYAAQLLRGSDYWRTVLDGASGIDIYGHNGVSAGDIDGDGLDDLYVCQPAGVPNRLFRNRGDGTFEDITEASGTGILEDTACALIVDVNNDGRQDLIVVRKNGPLLLLNEGGGKFRQKAGAFHFAAPPQGTFTGAAVADYDRDGWLDIYFCLYVFYQGADQYKYPSPYHDAENGPPNFMMKNNRDGTFRDVTAESGLNQNNTRYSFCCAWSDFDGDGWPDLCVVNDFGRKNLYRNNGNGTFSDIAAELGVEDFGAGMGVCWSDFDNDGAEDLHIANMWTAAGERISAQNAFKATSTPEVRSLYHKHAMGNSLFRNGKAGRKGAASGGFEDRTMVSGVGVGRWAWACDSVDFDHDGFADLYVTNGMVSGPLRDDLNSFFWRQTIAFSPDQAQASHEYEQGWSAINELIRSDGSWSGYERNVFYANNGNGTFSDISGVIGLDFVEDGRSFAMADFDLDGRQEIFLKNRNAPQLRILKNVTESLPPSISFRLRGIRSNRDAIGAVITIKTEQGLQSRSLQAGSGFLSQHSKDVFFGLGAAKGPLTASIRWPSGAVQELNDLPINHRIWIEEGAAPSRVEAFRTVVDASTYRQLAPQPTEDLPAIVETWLLAPIAAPDFSLPERGSDRTRTLSALRGKTVLLHFGASADEHTQKDWAAFSQHFEKWSAEGLQVLAVDFNDVTGAKANVAGKRALAFPVLTGSDDVASIYNILYRFMFDRRRDLGVPTSFLIDAKGQMVKVYQGPVDPAHVSQDFRKIPQTSSERVARALPFPGIAEEAEFTRNYLSYGSVYFQRGYLDQAGASFKLAVRDDPDSAEALYGVGSVYLNQEKLGPARECFERVIKMHASYPDTLAHAWNNLGLLAGRAGRTAEAIANFLEAVRLSPYHRVALNNLAQAYRMQKDWDNAQATYERVLQISPDIPEANYGLGMVYAQRDDTEHASEYLQRALKSRPNYPEALNNLGILYLRTDRVSEGIATFEKSIRVAPEFDQAYLNLAHVYAVEEQPDKAREVLGELLKVHPGHAGAERMLGELK